MKSNPVEDFVCGYCFKTYKNSATAQKCALKCQKKYSQKLKRCPLCGFKERISKSGRKYQRHNFSCPKSQYNR